MSTSEFTEKAVDVHGNRYDYSLTVYEHSLKKVVVICPFHGQFMTRPSNHVNNRQGCPQCRNIATSERLGKGVTTFQEELHRKPNSGNYGVLDNHIQTYRSAIHMKCNLHGIYLTTPRNVLRSKFFGCRACMTTADRGDTSSFVARSMDIHGDRYGYGDVTYTTAHTPVTITCPTHGEFVCKPYVHLSGTGYCPKCTNFVSSYELEIIQYLQSIGVSDIRSSVRDIPGIKEIDILSEEFKIGIEFNGLFWHSDRFKTSCYHLDKTEQMNALGYRLIHIFEDEWVNKRSICQSILSNVFNKTPTKIYARKCVVRDVTSVDSTNFLKLNHIQGSCVSRYRYGLYYQEELVMLMTFGGKRLCLGQIPVDGEFELLRLCSRLNVSVVGGASKLYTYFKQRVAPVKVISYCDRRYGTGHVYSLLGFKFIKNTRPNYFYTRGNTRYNRFTFRKDRLVLGGADNHLTEKRIMLDRGYNRLHDCGCMKFEHLNSP